MAAATTRTAVKAAADAAVGAAQIAAPGDRANEGVLAARIALAAARSPIIETRTPAVAAEPEQGQVQVLVFGGIISPVFEGGGAQRPGLWPPRRHRHLGPQQRRSLLVAARFGLPPPAEAHAAAARAAQAPPSGWR